MAKPSTVTIQGTVRDIYGELYEGAVIEVYLQNQMTYSDALIGNAIYKAYSNSYGKFSLKLVPSVVSSGNYYVFKIIKDTVNFYKKVVSGSPSIQNFDALPDYLPTTFQPTYIGDSGTQNIQTLPSDLTGIFQAIQYNGDGVLTLFSAPGEIFFVARNGVVQSEGFNYLKQGSDSIEFLQPPESSDLIAIFYRI